MRVRWSAYARARREEIFNYISSANPHAALNLDGKFSKAVQSLENMPHKGRLGRIEGTRELVVHNNYIIVYEEIEDAVNILTIHHTSRQYPLK